MHVRIRSETQDLHDRLEAVVAADEQTSARASYVRYLYRLWRLHRAAEDDLCGRDFSRFGFSYATRRRSPLLESDLAALDDPMAASQRADLPALPPFATPAAALGAVYVIEGSAMGARVLLAQITRNLDLDADSGASFFAGRPSDDRHMWRAVLAALAMIDPDGRDADAAVAGARAMFALFMRELPEPAHAGALVGQRRG